MAISAPPKMVLSMIKILTVSTILDLVLPSLEERALSRIQEVMKDPLENRSDKPFVFELSDPSTSESSVSEAVDVSVLSLCSLTQLSFICQPKDSGPDYYTSCQVVFRFCSSDTTLVTPDLICLSTRQFPR
nr:hypothetical protein [Tanacetum cinerariifolium]